MKRRPGQAELKSSAEIEFPITVRSLSEAIGRPANLLLKSLMQQGTMATVNSSLDEDQALELCLELGIDLKIKREQDIEERFDELMGDLGGERVVRPPIITIMGHVDHGKTTLLDKIRSANVAAGEIGGITQHIAAYQVEHNGRRITFLDTPGHAAFGEMRARGANVTDIAVLVVAANDGVMPQTIEALNHARAAEVPIVVAMNKIDLPDKNEQRVLQELATQNLLAAEWGGDTEVVRTSGQTGTGIDTLLETLLTVADLNEWKADPARAAYGVCLEAFRDEGRGPIAWLIIQEGTLRKGDIIVCGQAHGRIRNLYDDHDNEIEEAGPSTPVKVTGLDIVPGAGDKFSVLDDIEEAREIADTRAARSREGDLAQRNSRPQTIEDVLNAAQGGGVKTLPVILKADTPGSLEALKGELGKFDHPEVKVRILHTGVGGVNESDVLLASASKAIVVAFHVVPEDRAEMLAEREGVVIRQYGIIYEITDDIKLSLEGLLPPERVEVPTGRAIVLQTFSISRVGTIAGCRMLNGTIERSSRVRLIRDQRVLNDYDISSLKRVKDDVKEVREGQECGIRLQGFDDIKEGDMFQAFKIQEVKRTL
jgi:translation initiation factor IF-2